MISLTIGLEVMSRVGAQQNETVKRWYEKLAASFDK